MSKAGGRRQGAGRKPLAPSEKKKPITIWLAPNECKFCEQFGSVQDGIRHLISEAMKDDDDESGEAGQVSPRQPQ